MVVYKLMTLGTCFWGVFTTGCSAVQLRLSSSRTHIAGKQLSTLQACYQGGIWCREYKNQKEAANVGAASTATEQHGSWWKVNFLKIALFTSLIHWGWCNQWVMALWAWYQYFKSSPEYCSRTIILLCLSESTSYPKILMALHHHLEI